ncbi:MAG TPA: Calx-beta domain-containing protein [Pyrinomonadaceae bacterium]
MPRTNTRRCLTAALVAAAALAVWLGPRFTSAAAAQSETRFEFDAEYYRVSEGDGVATVTVVRTGDAAREASVEYRADSGYLFARGCVYPLWVGSATPDSDYTRTSGTLKFAPGETSKTFQVVILEDTQVESRQPETAFLSLDFSQLAPPGGDEWECYGSTSLLYIHDNDPAPTPTPTPVNTDKRKIAFDSNRDGNDELYVMDEDGTNVRRLTNHLAVDRHPTWSPDGTRLAFYSDRDGRNAVYLMNADGSNVTKLSNSPDHASDPVWSPDGTRLAFTAFANGLSSEVFVANVDGTGTPVNVSNNVNEDFAPSWSPDGKRLAFTSRRENNTFSLYVVGADGTGLKLVVNDYSREPAWSPDGGRIVYAGGVENGHGIYVVNADGTNRKMLLPTPPFVSDLSPAWSSDGARIAFASNRDAGPANYEIFVMNADGTGLTRITNNNPAHDGYPAWRPRPTRMPTSPVLLTEPGTTWAVALDSVTQVTDPFPVISSTNFSADRRTRVALFAAGVTEPNASDITAEAEDSAGNRHALPVEHAALVPGLDWLTQVTVRLPDELDGLEYVWVSLNVRGTLTNKAVITLQKQ